MKIITLFAILATLFLIGCSPDDGILGDIHWHADLKVYLDGQQYNLTQAKYMSAENNTLSNFAHLHDMNGDILHKHADGITLGFFFRTLGMNLSENCFTLDNGTSYCNEDGKNLKLYVNGGQNRDFGNYDFQDNDKILLTYGNDSEDIIKKQLESVTEDACIYSLTCPENGSPPPEASCVGDCLAEGGN